jgi:hypothetical protein
VVADEDVDFITFPRERLGKTYELNWTICKYAVIPNKVPCPVLFIFEFFEVKSGGSIGKFQDGEAYHNLHSRGLQMLSTATAGMTSQVEEQLVEPMCSYLVGCVCVCCRRTRR